MLLTALESKPARSSTAESFRRRDSRVAERLIREHRVAVIPGSAFGFERGCHLRVAYGALQKETAQEGVGRLVRGLGALVR